MALILDTETSGLPYCPRYGIFSDYRDLKCYSTSRLVQICYIITSDTFRQLEESSVIIKAKDFKIKNSQFHGITDEISQKDGIDFDNFAEMFNNSLDHVTAIIAHNIDFDINIICSELYRNGFLEIIKKINSKKLICSMKLTKNVVNATFKNSTDIKDPNLKELYHFCTGKELVNHHSCMFDVSNLLSIVQHLSYLFKID